MSAKFNLPNLPAQPNFELPSFNTTQQPVDPAIDQVNNYLLASLRHENINDPSLQGIEKDVATLTPTELLVKYGSATGSELIKRQATADANYIADRHQKRLTDEVIADTVSGVGKGIYNTLTGAVSLGLGMIPGAGDLSSAYSKAVEEGNQWIDSFDTEPLKNAKKAYQARQQVYDRASKYLFDEDIKNGVSPGRAHLRRIGRDITNITKNEFTDPAVMGHTLAQVTGSLVGAGVVSTMTRAGLSAAGVATETVDRLAWPIAIGMTEGGGGLQQGYQEVINTPIESLRETVPEFDLLVQEKIDSGLSVEQSENAVREDLALAVSRRVGALSAAAGMALGKVSQSMESAITSPLVRVPGKVIGSRVGGELVEEGGIGATNAFGTNLAIQQLVDANRDLSEGVGTELGSGALYGAASAGIVQAPHIALNTAETAVKTAGKGVNALIDRGIASKEAKAGHSPKSQQDSLKFLLAYQQALQAKQQDSEQPLTNQEQVELNTLDSLNSTKVEGVETTKVNDVLNNSNNKVDALHNLDYQARKGNLTQEELDDNAIATVNLASDVIALQNTQKDLVAEEATENSTAVRDAVNNVYKDSKAKNIIRKSLDVVIGLANNSSDINTKAKATKAAIKAGLLGEISLETYKDILSAVDKNQIQLSEEDKDLISLAQTVMEEEHNLFEKQDKGDTFALESTAKVRHQLLMGLNEEYEKTKHYSLNQLLRKLVFAHQTKNTAEEADIITRINNLRLQQASKLEALQKSINAGGTINNTFAYQSLHPADNVLLPSDSDKLNLNNPKLGVTIGAVESEKLAKTIEKELDVLTNITNKIIDSKLFNPVTSYLNLQKTTANKLNWNPKVINNNNNSTNNNSNNNQQVVAQPSVQPQMVQQQPAQQQVVKEESTEEEELAPWEGEDTFNKESSKETTTTTENTENTNTPVEETKTSNEKVEVKTSEESVEPVQKVKQSSVSKETKETKKEVKSEITPEVKTEAQVQPQQTQEVVQETQSLTKEAIEREIAEIEEELNIQQEALENTQDETDIEEINYQISELKERLRNAKEVLRNEDTTSNKYKTISKKFGEIFSLKKNVSKHISSLNLVDSIRNSIKSDKFNDIPTKLKGKFLNLRSSSKYNTTLKEAVLNLFKPDSRDKQNYAYKVKTQAKDYINAWLNSKNEDGVTNKELILSGKGKDIQGHYLIPLLQRTPNGLEINNELLNRAVTASVSWFLQAKQGQRYRSSEDWQEFFKEGYGKPHLNSTIVNILNKSVFKQSSAESLAKKIQNYWGLKANDDASYRSANGIPLEMANLMLTAMQDTGMLKQHSIKRYDVDDNELPETITVFEHIDPDTNLNEGDQTKKNAIWLCPSILDDLVAVEKEYKIYIDEVPELITNKLHSSDEITEKQKEQLKGMNAIEYYVDTEVTDFYEAIGEENFVKLFGLPPVKSDVANQETIAAVEGKNNGLRRSFREMQSYVQILRTEYSHKDIESIPRRFQHAITSVNRYQQLGSITPQGEKFMREWLSSTKSIIDLTKVNNREKYYRSIGQAFGIKIEKQDYKQTKNRIDEISKALEPSKQIIKNFLASRAKEGELALNGNDAFKFTWAELEAIKNNFDQFKVDFNHLSLKAFVDLVRFENSSKEEKSAYRTNLYVEADGVTNGVIMLLLNFMSGRIDAQTLFRLARGGVSFFGKRALQTLYTPSTYWHNTQDPKLDIYGLCAKAFSNSLNAITDPVQKQMVTNFLHIGSLTVGNTKLLDGIGSEENLQSDTPIHDWLIARNFTKNPVTTINYGSGHKSIAVKIKNQLVKNLYKGFTQAAIKMKANPKLTAVEAMFGDNSELSKQKMQSLMAFLPPTFVKDMPSINNIANFKQADFAKFIFSANQEKDIVSVIDEAVTTQLKAEIEQNAIGQEIIDNLQAIQDATNIQAAIQKDLFIAEFNELWQKDFTVGEYKAFKAKNRAVGPVIYNGDYQVFNLSDDSQMRETGDDDVSFIASKGLGKFDSGKQDNKLIGRNNLIRFPIAMPTQPGVKSKPNLNIGFGDGMIMGKLANLTNCLHVHDGFNIRLQDLDEYSLLANKAVYDSIMDVNPYESVLASFNNTISLAQKYKKPLSKEAIRTVANIKATSLEFESKKDREAFINDFTEKDAFAVIEFLQYYLDRTADSAKKLKEAYKSVPMSIDQMAGLENPYTNKRNTKKFNSVDDVVNAINEKYDSIDNKDSYNRTVDTMGYTTNVFDFGDSLFKERTQKWVWNLVKKINNLSTTAVTFFNEKDFARVKTHYGITDKVSGFYVPNLNKIFILRKSEDFSKEAETILHEIFHAAITKKVINAQNGEVDSLSKQAYEQINKLRKQFVNMCYQEPRKMQALLKKAMVESGIAKSSEEVNAKYDVVKNTFEFYLKEFNVNENDSDAVMAANDEFITYILTKPFMTSLASNMEVKAEKNFFKRAFEKVILFLWGPNHTFGQGKTLLSQIKFSISVIVGESIQNENVTLGSSEVSIPPRLSKIAPQPLGQSTINSNVTIDDVTQYSKLMATIYTALKKDSKLLPQLTDIYTKLSKKLTAKDFENATTSPLEAESKFDTVFGISLNKDEIIPNLLALSLTSKEVRDVLNTVDLDELIKDPSDGTLDNWLRKQGETLVQKLQDKVAKISSTGETDQVIADLYQRLQQSNVKQKTMFTQIVDWDEKLVDVYQDINDGLVEILDDLGTKLSKKAEQVKNTSSNEVVKSIAAIIKTLGLSFNPVMGEAAKTTFTSIMNVFYNPNGAVSQQAAGLYNLGLDIVGKFKGNAYIYNFIKLSKQKLQKARQYTRDYMPKLLRDCFSTEVSDEESTAMYKVIAKCDLEALSNYGLDTINSFINDKVKLNKELDRLTNSIQAIKSPVMIFDKQLALQKCAELAEFMLTGKAVDGQLKNADVIAYVSTSVDKKVPDSEVKEFRDSIAKVLDKYTSLLALEKLDKETIKNWNRVFNEEKEGVKALYAIYGECKQYEKKKINDQIKYNVLKGYIPSEKVTQNTVVIANTSDDLMLKQSGFTKVKDYVGSSKEVQQHKAYYVTKVNPKAIFNQGIMQLASMTAFGVDVSTGYSSQFTGGFTTKSSLIVEVEKEVYSKSKSNRAEGLIPVWKNGYIIALERSIDPEVYKEQLESSTNIFAMLPAWKGRQIEETNAYEHNMDCINRLYEGYKNDKDKNNNYVNIFEVTDPVFKESLSLIPAEFKQAMKAKFGGKNVFMVRKDLIRDIFGERSASIRDLFDGTGRINPKISNAVRRIIIALFGNKALVVTGEQAVMGTMAWARNNIVVRSVAVPILNIIGNITHLMMRGIPLSYILRNIPKLIVESERYTKSELEIIAINAKLSIHALNQAEREKLEARKKVLKHMQERLFIYPLIEQGEFGSIGDIGNTEEELGFISNKFVDSVKKAVDKLPDSVVSAGKYALITKDTALYQGLQKSVQYGDFFAKSIYYQYIMEHPEKYERFVPRLEADKRIRPLIANNISKYSKEGLKDLKQFALDRILEEFVDYDRQVGRTRQYMENIGLLWFYNFKIRSIKVMLSVLRENPLAAMLFIWAAPIITPFGLLGTALTDNLIGKALQGDLGYTQGWDMLYNAPYMNPWISMVE